MKLRKKGDNWYFRYRDATGRERERKGCTNFKVTLELQRAAEIQAAQERAGLIDPAQAARIAANKETIDDHLIAWRHHLLAKGATEKHAELSFKRARRVAALSLGAELRAIDPPKTATLDERDQADSIINETLKNRRLNDLNAERVQTALATLKADGRSNETVNHHRTAIRSFAKWCSDTNRLASNPLARVTGFNAAADRRHDRRTIGIDELRRLIATAENGPDYRRMTGPARALVYRVAASTGLRYAEIGSLTARSFNLAANPATVTVTAGYSKNGQTATLDLPDDLANDIGRWIASLDPDAAAFELPDKGSKMLRFDLERAGIDYVDAAGNYFDFHALRCEHATLLDAAGVSPRVVQKKMRHSTLELTGRYTKPRLIDLQNATRSLPSLTAPNTELAQSTGTDEK